MPKAKLTIENEKAFKMACKVVEVNEVDHETIGDVKKSEISFKRPDDLFRLGQFYKKFSDDISEKTPEKPAEKSVQSKK